jgi:precorrin-4 methylase
MPIVVVENGTRDNELAVATTLADLADAILAFGIAGPAIIFGNLAWNEANLTMPDKVHVYRAPADRSSVRTRSVPAPDAL